MTPLGALLQAKLRSSRHAVHSIRHHSRLKVAVVSLSALLLWGGAFAASVVGFRWLEAFGTEIFQGAEIRLSTIVMSRLLSLFALAVFVMLVFSNVLVVFATLFRAREVAFLVQSPLPTRTLFLARFAEAVSFSSWSTAFLGSPVLLAYGLVTGAPPFFYLAAVAFYLPFVALPAGLGALLTLGLARLLPYVRRSTLGLVGAVAAAGVFLFFRSRLAPADLSGAATVGALLGAFGRPQSAWLPSSWAAEGVLAAASGDLGRAIFLLLLLTANALLLVWLATEVAARLFFITWSDLAGTPPRRRGLSGPRMLGRIERWLVPLSPPMRALVAKDIRTFWRDPAQWSQFVIFFGLMALYLANMRPTSDAWNRELWQGWLTLLNLAACMLILATLTTRFVYPLVSLEGRRWWLLGLSPLPRRLVAWQKFWLAVVTTSIITVALMVVSNTRLGLPPIPFAVSIFSVLAGNLALAGLAVGLGCLYPNFDEDNPARIISGLGGTLNFILSVGYVVLLALAQTTWLHWSIVAERLALSVPFGIVTAGYLTFVVGLTATACLLPMRAGLAHLEQVEI